MGQDQDGFINEEKKKRRDANAATYHLPTTD